MRVELKDVLHLYFDCPVEIGYEGSKMKGRLVGKHDAYGWQVLNPRSAFVPYHTVKDELIKPILRPLSDMTEEENDECSKLYFDFMESQVPGIRDIKMMAHMAKWYLSKHFDLFNLIESGQAIDSSKTTVK